MTGTLPLLVTNSLDAPIAVYRGQTIAAGQFIATVEALVAKWPAATHVVNLCENRYHFALAWAAACLRSQITLLPPNQARGVLADLAATYPDQHTIDDEAVASFLAPPKPTIADKLPGHWHIPAQRVVALTFTSGSTGLPQAHSKTWLTLSRNAQLACDGVLGGPGARVVATVPAQHVYGLETSLISALTARCTIYDDKPFFPQDVRSALAGIDGPRTLVTTPTHLKTLLDSNIPLPALNRVVSATAPLAVELARRIETAWSTSVFEIYGCTEAGIMARRRASISETWETFPDATMVQTDRGAEYHAPQLPEAIALQDIVESIDATHFHLRGRAADMLKVAGKRTSLQEITRHLLAVPGVHDAAVFVPHTDARPVAFVVAPGISSQTILAALADRIETVFLPRPLLHVERLPRNELGKLPRAALQSLWSATKS